MSPDAEYHVFAEFWAGHELQREIAHAASCWRLTKGRNEMSNPSNATSISTLKTAHAAAETGGVTFNTGAVPSVGNMGTTWSRASARALYGAGTINQTQFNEIMNALAVYEETQYQAARDTEGSTASGQRGPRNRSAAQ